MIWAVEAQWNSETKWYSWWYAGLTEVPHDIPAEALEVDLRWNQIEVIRENTFTNLSVCERLWLYGNKIHTIETGAWNGLISLKWLSLGDKIELLWPGMFSGLDDCTELYLQENNIHTIQSGAWEGLDSLVVLWLGDNEIEELKQDTFLGLTQCTALYLYSNKIHTIHSGVLDGLVSLTQLNLQGNELTTLPWTMFGKEHPAQLELRLSANPLECNTSLCWLKHAEQEGWVTWYTDSWGSVYKPDCSGTNTDWDDVTLDCTHLGMY